MIVCRLCGSIGHPLIEHNILFFCNGRNLSQGSSDAGFYGGGSLEKEKKRRQQQLDEGRIDAEKVIDELMEAVDLRKVDQEEAESEKK